MSGDFGLDSWLEIKSRKESKKYSTGHSYKQKKVVINKNEYVQIEKQNELLNSFTISIDNGKAVKKVINIPENCLFRNDKRNNSLITNLLTNVKINTDKKNIERKSKSERNVIHYRDEENDQNYKIEYDIVQENESKGQSQVVLEAKNVEKKEKKNNNHNKVRREKIKAPKVINSKSKITIKPIAENKIASYKIIKPDNNDIQYKKQVKDKESKEKRVNKSRKHKDKCNELYFAVEDIFVEEVDDMRDEMRIVNDILSNVTLNKTKNSIDFVPFIQKKSLTTDLYVVKNEFCKELVGNTCRKINDKLCEICFSNTQELFTLNSCDHKACLNCWQKYAQTVIESFKIHFNSSSQITNNGLNCIYDGCSNNLSIEFLYSILPIEIVQKYMKFYTEERLEKSDKYAKCLNIKCNRIILINTHSAFNISVCECSFFICNTCHKSAHYPISCKDDLKFRTNLNLDNHKRSMHVECKSCPKCERPIEKNGGCSHMRCICGADFCWECGQFSSNHNDCNKKKLKLEVYKIEYFDSPAIDQLNECNLLFNQIEAFKPKIGQDINKTIQNFEKKFSKLDDFLIKNNIEMLKIKKVFYLYLTQLFIRFEQIFIFCKYEIIKDILAGKTLRNTTAIKILKAWKVFIKSIYNVKSLDEILNFSKTFKNLSCFVSKI